MAEDWVSARRVLDMVLPRYRHPKDAEIAIYRRCAARQIKSKADLLQFRPKVEEANRRDIELPSTFWSAIVSALLAEKLQEMSTVTRWQDWEIGDFSVSIDGVDYSASGVMFDRTGVAKMLLADTLEESKTNKVLSYSAVEIDKWIQNASFTGMKAARDAFMKQPRATGLSATFEAHWRAIHPRGPGRPPKMAK